MIIIQELLNANVHKFCRTRIYEFANKALRHSLMAHQRHQRHRNNFTSLLLFMPCSHVPWILQQFPNRCNNRHMSMFLCWISRALWNACIGFMNVGVFQSRRLCSGRWNPKGKGRSGNIIFEFNNLLIIRNINNILLSKIDPVLDYMLQRCIGRGACVCESLDSIIKNNGYWLLYDCLAFMFIIYFTTPKHSNI